MFRFENPQYLFLLAIPVILTALHYLWQLRQKKRLATYGDPALLQQLMVDVSPLRRNVKFAFLMLSIASMVVALARPQYGTKMEKRERQGIEAIIALDVSNSMMAEDVRPCRLEKAKMLVSNMVDEMTDDKVGLIVFAGQAFTQLPITSDYVSAKMFLETVSPRMIDVQGTDIAAAITLAQRSFTRQEGVSRAIFLITDGEDNEGGGMEAAKAAAKAGIHVYVLGIGDPAGAPVPMPGTNQYFIDNEGNTVLSRLSEEMCRDIAAVGNGAYIYVDNSSSAQSALNKYLDKLSKASMESMVYSEFDEQYQGFVWLSLIFLLLDLLLLERENHVLKRFAFFKRTVGVLVILMCCSMQMNAQSDRDFIRHGNRQMRDSIYDKAQVNYQKAIEKNPNNPIARYNLGTNWLYQSKAEEAMKEYELASRQEKDKKRLASIWHNMGVVMQAAKQFDKAIACYKQALRNDPMANDTRYNYVLCQRQLKNQQDDQQQDQQQQQQDQQQQQNQEQQKQQQQKDDGQQQKEQPKPNEMSKENAEQLLKAAQQDEKDTQQKVQRQQQQPQSRRLEKQW